MADDANENRLPEPTGPNTGGDASLPPERGEHEDRPTIFDHAPDEDVTDGSAFPRLAGYEITGKVSDKGGQGVIWRGVQRATNREVAIKFLRAGVFSSRQAQARFEREVELTAGLEHPHIARVYDSGLHRGAFYYAMELIDGRDLNNYVWEEGLTLRETLALMRTVCLALQHAHQRGIIHRDLKPSNILVDAEGQPHVLDFGLAKALETDGASMTVSETDGVLGTPIYMSPEQASGRFKDLDTRTDVYSLGVVLFELLTSIFPHDCSGGTLAIYERVIHQEPRRPRAVRPKEIDRELEAVILKALAKDPELRYASAGELAQDIDNYLNGEPLTARKPTTLYFLRKRIRKYRLQVGVAAAVLAALVAVAVYAYVRIADERNRAVIAEKNTSKQRDKASEEAENARRAKVEADKARKQEVRQRQIAENERGDALKAKTQEEKARKEAEEQRRRAEKEVYRYGISEADRLSQVGMYTDARKLLNTLEPKLRGWEYGHLMCRSIRRDFGELLALKAHSGGVASVAFSPDGRHLGSGGRDKTIKIWDTVRGKEILTLKGHLGNVNSVTFSPDGRRLASGSGDKTVKLWDAATGKELLTLKGHSSSVNSVAFSPDGKRLASGSDDWTIKLWDTVIGEKLLTLKGHSSNVNSVAFSPDGRSLASGSKDGTIKLWEVLD